MRKIWKVLNLIILAVLILICILGTFYKHISFGLGFGDVLGYSVLYLGTLVHLILTITSKNKGNLRFASMASIFFILTVFIILFATIWRGSEYKWNGSIFYVPCPQKIVVDNQDIQKEILISMCSMDYYSEFTGSWNGQFLVINTGDIKIPKELKLYVKTPIAKIKIEPDVYEIYKNEGLKKEFNFNKDTLQINQQYKFSGEVQGIQNKILVIKAKVK